MMKIKWRFYKAFLSSILVLSSSQAALGKVADDAAEKEPCGQTKVIRDPLIDEATAKYFNTRRVEISGSTYTRHRKFVRHMEDGLMEGNIFTLTALEKTVKRISKMKSIYPITMDNIEIHLDREQNDIDIVICVEQRPRK